MLKISENIEYIETVWPRRAFIIKKMGEHYQGGRVLDIGCGNGKKTEMLGKLGVDILGIDLDEHEIRKAIDTNQLENVQFACVDIKEITGKFSGVVLIEVLEHIEDPLDFLKEIYRLCENNGFLIVTVPNGYSVKEMVTRVIHGSAKSSRTITRFVKWYRKITNRDSAFNESQHVQWFTLKRIRVLLEEAGFTIKEEAYYGIWSALLWVCVPWIKVPLFVKRMEKKLTRYVPPYLSEGWGFLCLKEN